MDITEAYRQAQQHLYRDSPDSASQLEVEAETRGLPTLWLCAAGAHARKGDITKFAEALRNAALISDDTVVQTLASDTEQAFALIVRDSESPDYLRRIFGRELHAYLYWNKRKSDGRIVTVEDLIQELERKPISQTGNSFTIRSTNKTFEAYKLRTPQEIEEYERRVETLKNHSLLFRSGKEENTGWLIWMV